MMDIGIRVWMTGVLVIVWVAFTHHDLSRLTWEAQRSIERAAVAASWAWVLGGIALLVWLLP